MKSAAFNLAFQVHRSEISFPEGLLRSVESAAQEDFIEALNTLAGETRYNVDQLDTLIEEAQRQVNREGGPGEPAVDAEALKEEIESLKRKRSDMNERLETLEFQNASLKPSVIPGINSVLLGIVGGVFMLLSLVLQFSMAALFFLVVTLAISGYYLMKDLSELKIQQEDIAQKKTFNLANMEKTKSALEELNAQVAEKQDALNNALKDAPIPTSEIPQPRNFAPPSND